MRHIVFARYLVLKLSLKHAQMPWSYLVGGQDLEGGHDLFSSVGFGSLAGHEVDEGLEGHHACVVGVHQGHNAGELHLTLSGHNQTKQPMRLKRHVYFCI